MIHKVEHVLTDATKIGWGHVVIVCNNYFALLLHNITHKHNYHLERNIPINLLHHISTYLILPGRTGKSFRSYINFKKVTETLNFANII